MYHFVKNYMFEATYWIIAVVYDKTSEPNHSSIVFIKR